MPIRTLIKSQPKANFTDIRPLGKDAKNMAADIHRYFNYTLGRDKYCKSAHYTYNALALAVRDRLMEGWKKTHYAYRGESPRQTFYLSMEFLMGRTLGNAMLNLGLEEPIHKALHKFGLDLEELAEVEHDAGLGNGGLGRLAACFIDSCATLQLPVIGYGLRYEYGMFRQRIDNGYQAEEPDHWLRAGNVWELERPELTVRVHFYGHTETYADHAHHRRLRWVETQDVLVVPYDIPVPGYRNDTVNTLRLWKTVATDEFDLNEFNAGDYAGSVAGKNSAENISMVLYPNDASECGKELRLRQQYVLASASLQDVVRKWVIRHGHGEDFTHFAEQNCFQLNDTHPSIAVAELMRILMDEHLLSWDAAWKITTSTMAYTNHTLLPEALEKWSVGLMRYLLPRLMEIIFEINARFLAEVAQNWPGDSERLARMSLIEEDGDQKVRMAYLAIVGSYSVNGVAELHSNLLKQGLFKDFYELWPDKFNNKTNGITPRRWLGGCNPKLAELITANIGDGWTHDLTELKKLAPLVDDAAFRERWRTVKRVNKQRLLETIHASFETVDAASGASARSSSGEWEDSGSLGLHLTVGVDAMFDVQVKRIHEYKRQLLNVLHVIHLYDRIKHGEIANWTPRLVLFGGKAAPGYAMAKKIIKLINNVAHIVNHDPATAGLLSVVFLPNYRVSAMEVIAAAADLSEQISTAGKEASGTGNMKFMMNGALTMGTLDGANIEILEEVGGDNFFLFGLTAQQVEKLRPHYDPRHIIADDDDFSRVMHLLESSYFNQFEPGIFDDIINVIKSPKDPWMTAADFPAYVQAQRHAAEAFLDVDRWTQMSILNCAASGKFSSDRTIAEYNRDIWKLTPVKPVGDQEI
ncbi:glycogen/starch/alpha-glucan phosphorylase [Candidatus Methylospira mobilis]|uniref:Alpha-1,4 glucan phosphorylase n=1 Tax=Candidatus Methylospira mobilis TaxID=1808979 RepID=A0A5Q0BJF2_9GAMM|nr:glycogen/starch/alpha-glucan phosphorylase [Candidatus Methylospira mobilis]QFY42341.1 glycogen/starch/alpha-glucan phosphorylase [Candidatus Methylospira mobilis]